MVVCFACVSLAGCGEREDSGEESETSSIWVGDGSGHSAEEILRAASALAVEENVLIRFQYGGNEVEEMEVVSRAAYETMPSVEWMVIELIGNDIVVNKEKVSDVEILKRLGLIRKLALLSESRTITIVGADDAAEGTRLVWLFHEMVARDLRWIGAVW
jgi:hypothetical protein